MLPFRFFQRKNYSSFPLSRIVILTGMVWCALPALTSAQSLPNTFIFKTQTKSVSLTRADMDAWTTVDTSERIDRFLRSEIEETNWCTGNHLISCDFFLSRNSRLHTIITHHTTIREESLKNSVMQTAKELDEKPQNAILAIKDNTMIIEQPEQSGFQVDIEQTVEAVRTILLTSHDETVTLDAPGTLLEATTKGSDIERLGIKDLIAEGSTNFSGSPKNRIFNINRSLQQFQGVLIAPGEEFSFVNYLGPVDEESGYLPELVIKNNRTEPEFGGGICQVSSTVFRTAIFAGLKITARRNHAYPISYYRPYGMDATIYIPNPDLRFINNTPGHIFLQSSISGTKLTFQMYGTRDGRQVAVDGPHILESNPDGSMRTIFTQEVSNAEGQNFIRDSFRSNYKSPSLFPHPGDEILKVKPADWSKRQWEEYEKTHAR
jgi:vancomycin resistance protein YoaR